MEIAGSKAYLIEFYEGEILYKKGDQKRAIEFWQKICANNPDNSLCYFLFADECANFAMYDIAIEYYRRSFEIQTPPRRIDSLISMLQIYEIKANYSEAYNVLNLILSVYETDYVLTDGDEIQPYLDDRERIQKLITN